MRNNPLPVNADPIGGPRTNGGPANVYPPIIPAPIPTAGQGAPDACPIPAVGASPAETARTACPHCMGRGVVHQSFHLYSTCPACLGCGRAAA